MGAPNSGGAGMVVQFGSPQVSRCKFFSNWALHEGGAVQALRRAEDLAGQRMGQHDVVADFDGEHRVSPHG